METKSDRLKIAFEYLKSKGIIHTQKELADIMGTSAPNVSSAFKGNETYLTSNFVKRFNDSFNNIFNNDWLLTGIGDMLDPNRSMIQIGDHGIQQQGFSGNDLKQTIRSDGSFKEFVSGLEKQNDLIKQAMAQTDKALNEMAEQRKQMDRLISMIERLQK